MPSIVSGVEEFRVTMFHTLTAMIYAMVKKVVRPARISVVNLVFLISLSCGEGQDRESGE